VEKSGVAMTPTSVRLTGAAAAQTALAVRILLAALAINSGPVASADDAIFTKVTMPLAIAVIGCAKTNEQVASWSLLVPTGAVGADGVPMKAGESSGAREASVGWT